MRKRCEGLGRLPQAVAGAQAKRRRAADRQEQLQRSEAAARSGLEGDNAALREQLGVLAEVRAKRLAADEEVIRLRTELRQKDSELASQVCVGQLCKRVFEQGQSQGKALLPFEPLARPHLGQKSRRPNVFQPFRQVQRQQWLQWPAFVRCNGCPDHCTGVSTNSSHAE